MLINAYHVSVERFTEGHYPGKRILQKEGAVPDKVVMEECYEKMGCKQIPNEERQVQCGFSRIKC